MKKFKKALLPGVLAGALVITGCSVPGLSSNGDVYISTKEGDITQKDVLDYMGDQVISNVATEAAVQKILLNKYKDKIDNAAIDKQVAELETQMGGKEQLETALKSQGTTLEKYKEKMKVNSAMVYMILDAKGIDENKINEQANKEKTQYNLAHILITVKSDAIPTGVSDEEAKAKIDEVKTKLDAGEDFATLAKEYSTDTSNAANGGELGWSSKESSPFVKEFSDVAYSVEKGKYSDVVKTQFGYHIIKLLDTKDVNPEEIKSQVAAGLAQKAITEDPSSVSNALKKLFEEYQVKGNTDTIKAYIDSMLAGNNQAAQLVSQSQTTANASTSAQGQTTAAPVASSQEAAPQTTAAPVAPAATQAVATQTQSVAVQTQAPVAAVTSVLASSSN